jgi:hypothetical protein
MKLLYQPGTILSVLKWLMGSQRAQRARWPYHHSDEYYIDINYPAAMHGWHLSRHLLIDS